MFGGNMLTFRPRRERGWGPWVYPMRCEVGAEGPEGTVMGALGGKPKSKCRAEGEGKGSNAE